MAIAETTTIGGRVFFVWVTAHDPHVDHAVTDEEMAARMVEHRGVFRALCGAVFLPAPDTRPSGPRCLVWGGVARVRARLPFGEERLRLHRHRAKHACIRGGAVQPDGKRTVAVGDRPIPPILVVRLKSRLPDGSVVGESRRVCQLVPGLESAGIPSVLRAYCGAEIAPGMAELLDGIAGMPCERCLAASPVPVCATLRGLPAGMGLDRCGVWMTSGSGGGWGGLW